MKKILLVDDDRISRTLLRHCLKKQGYEVEEVASATEALVTFRQSSPDLVVSDVLMPQINGFEFCQKLRSTPSGQLVPFIFLTSQNHLKYLVESHSIGADAYLSKPFEISELLVKINALLEKSPCI
ncbi:MAG: response regulator [Prochloraceae cyanobacterium]|nr:response regulator [Prochloraceae cyanobacterium]